MWHAQAGAKRKEGAVVATSDVQLVGYLHGVLLPNCCALIGLNMVGACACRTSS